MINRQNREIIVKTGQHIAAHSRSLWTNAHACVQVCIEQYR